MLTFLKTIPKFIRDLVCIAVISVSAGFLAYYFSDGSFSFEEENISEINENQASVISIEEAKSFFDSGTGLFVDSRSKKYFEKSHIQGAFNLPAENHLEYSFDFLSAFPDKTVKIIVYCDGKTCDSSFITAGFLKDLGYEDVNILINGWSLWKENNLPVFSPEN